MTIFLDARVPVRIGSADQAGPDHALLIEQGAALPAACVPFAQFVVPVGLTHPAGCACCVPRGPVAEALTRLFLARVRGETRHFSAVIAVPVSREGEAAIRAALLSDPMVSARFRLCE